MRVKVEGNYQVKHGNKMYVGGDSFDVADSEGEKLIRRGYVKAVSGSKNKAVTPEQAENKADDLSSKTKAELYEMAQDQDIEGRAGMDKDELIKALGG